MERKAWKIREADLEEKRLEERDKRIREYSQLQQQHVNDTGIKSESHAQVGSIRLLAESLC